MRGKGQFVVDDGVLHPLDLEAEGEVGYLVPGLSMQIHSSKPGPV